MTSIHATGAPVADAPDSFARKALIASAVGYAMDGFDLLILGFMLRAISADLHLTPPQAGSLVTWTLVGAVAGGILFGMLSDYYGRVRVLTWTILLFAVFTGLCALAQGYWDLLVYRTIAGLGLGGEFGIGMALVAEAGPARQRARACSYVALGWQAGVLCAALLTPLLLPSIGWRGMFVVGLIPGVIAFAVRWYVGEPKIFVERAKTAHTMAPLKMLVKDAATSKGRFVNGMLGGYGALLSELYPTEARATAENVLFNLGRGVGGFGPVVVGALVVSYSFTVAIALLATIYLLDIVATLLLIPEKKGQPLE